MKNNVLPFPSLRRMEPDPPRRPWLRDLAVSLLVLAAVVAVIFVFDAVFGR